MANVMDFINDRISGMTFEEIGNKHGVSRQYVHQELQKILNMCSKKEGQKGVGEIIYPGLRKWFVKNNLTIASVERECNFKNTMLSRKLRGKNRLCKHEIDVLLKLTGLTYEEAFAEEADNV